MSTDDDTSNPDGGTRAAPSSPGALDPIPVRAILPPTLPASFLGTFARRERWQGAARPAQRRQRGVHAAPTGAIDWFRTLLGRPRPMLSDLRRRPRRLARGGRWVIALDCSASMLKSGALAAAKGVAQALVTRAASSSARLALISFGGDEVRSRISFDAGSGDVERAIADLGAAGGTPLVRAVQLGLELANRAPADPVERRLLIFTDGRTREDLTDAAAYRASLDVTLIDCELGALRLGRARRIASTLRASYVHIESLLEPGPSALEDEASTALRPRSRIGQHQR